MRKDDKGRIHLKLVFYGPSLGGKTTALRWLYGKVEGLQKGEFTSIEDETNRTLFFDYVPMSAGGRVLFDVFTVVNLSNVYIYLFKFGYVGVCITIGSVINCAYSSIKIHCSSV